MTGDATRTYLTTASIKDPEHGIGESRALTSFFFSPTGYLRSVTLFIGEFVKELFQARRTRRAGIRPQMHRGLKYAGMRAASNVFLRDMNTSLIIVEMHRGANVIYADFTDYDEIAHHSGPERIEALQALDGDRRRDRHAGEGGRGRAAPVQVHRPVGPRPEPRRDVPPALRQDAGRGGPRPDGRPGDGRRVGGQGRGLGVRQLDAVRGHPGRRRQRRGGSGGVREPDRGRRRQPRPRGGAAARRRVDDRGRGLRQPRARVLHGLRAPPHARGARGEEPRPDREAVRAPGRSAC